MVILPVHVLAGIHAATTLALTGLIWMVQCVHYPLFKWVAKEVFCEYEAAHTRRITWLVGPLMLVEAASAWVLMFMLESSVARLMDGVGIVLLLAIWLSTAFLQMPCHARLSRGFDELALRRLIVTNWIRTAAWSVRGVISILLLRQLP